MPRPATPSWYYVLVVVRRDDQYLLVQERKHGQPWYLPAGGVERGESLVDAALRETREEAGIAVDIEGILRIEHSPFSAGARVRVFFSARPVDDTPPKQAPDSETLQAQWFRFDELSNLVLRGEDVRHILNYVEQGRPVAPLSMLGREGQPF